MADYNKVAFVGTPEIVEIAEKLYQSYRWHKRLLAVDIFNQLFVV